jgi:hypothetical protein
VDIKEGHDYLIEGQSSSVPGYSVTSKAREYIAKTRLGGGEEHHQATNTFHPENETAKGEADPPRLPAPSPIFYPLSSEIQVGTGNEAHDFAPHFYTIRAARIRGTNIW